MVTSVDVRFLHIADTEVALRALLMGRCRWYFNDSAGQTVLDPTVEAGMKIKVTVQPPRGRPVEHIADVQGDGDILTAFNAAVVAYKNTYNDFPLFDHSKIKIERA